MRALLEEVLLLQREWSSKSTPAMERRGKLVRQAAPAWLRSRLVGRFGRALAANGSDGSGSKSAVPWFRVFDPALAPRATKGWYVVYLFAAGGGRVFLSLNQGTRLPGALNPRPDEEIKERVAWAHRTIGHATTIDRPFTWHINLDSRGRDLGRSYELGNVLAVEYSQGAVPDEPILARDLDIFLNLLNTLYEAEDHQGAVERIEDPPELLDAAHAVAIGTGSLTQQQRGQGFHQSAADRRAIEMRAMAVAEELFRSRGWQYHDVHSTESCDFICIDEGGKEISVEVKGTTSHGEAILITRAELELHQRMHPDNALVVVHSIELDRTGNQPVATGGRVRFAHPWSIIDSAVVPLAYKVDLIQTSEGMLLDLDAFRHTHE
ncbi:MrcB family domain-containing protein [Jiangella endophytica]|uniref:MrcB family domain-containing protein n=1 Tax=Jiangella endophytica TaxID=1623398 RepID=UPI000E343E60|nr:DUF3578 domain-containing protein [Jiangella endophytica]